MTYVPPNAEQTTLRICIQGVEKEVHLVRNPDGSPMQASNGYLYEAYDGQRVTLRFAASNENSLPPAQPPMPASASDGDDAASASLPEAALELAEDEPELWSARKTKFFLAKYVDMKDLVGKTRALRTRKQLWLKLTELINKEFKCNMSATQVENKWKSLDRAYKKSKRENNSSGHHRVSCENEEELGAILEKEHSVNPRILLEPGKTIFPSGIAGTSATGAGPSVSLPVPVEGSTAPKKMRHSKSQLGPLLEVLQKMGESRAKELEARQKWEEAKAKRHDDRMERFDRLIDLLEKKQETNGQ